MKSIKVISVIILVLLLSGCETDEHLDLYPPNSITEGNFYKSLYQLQQAHDNIYFQLGRMYEANSVTCIYGERLSDNTHAPFNLGGVPFDEWINAFLLTPENLRFETAWNNSYNINYIINIITVHLNQLEGQLVIKRFFDILVFHVFK